MTVNLSPESEAFLREIVEANEFGSLSEALDEAVRLLRARCLLEEQIRAGLNDLDHGRFTEYDAQSFHRVKADMESEKVGA